jgi:hypothetical protein
MELCIKVGKWNKSISILISENPLNMLAMVRLRGKDQNKKKVSANMASCGLPVAPVLLSSPPNTAIAPNSCRRPALQTVRPEEETRGLSRMWFGEFAQHPAEVTRFAVCGWTRVPPVTRVTGRGTTVLCVSGSVFGSGATNKQEI